MIKESYYHWGLGLGTGGPMSAIVIFGVSRGKCPGRGGEGSKCCTLVTRTGAPGWLTARHCDISGGRPWLCEGWRRRRRVSMSSSHNAGRHRPTAHLPRQRRSTHCFRYGPGSRERAWRENDARRAALRMRRDRLRPSAASVKLADVEL